MEHDETVPLQVRADIFKALGHPVRLQMVEFLMAAPRCVAEIAEEVGGSISIVSQHLAILRQSGIIVDERQSRKIYYALATPEVTEFCAYLTNSLAPTLRQTSAKRRKAKRRARRVARAVALASILLSVTLLTFSSALLKREGGADSSLGAQAEVQAAPVVAERTDLTCQYAALRLCRDPLGTGLACGEEMWHVLGEVLELCEREAQLSAL